MEQHLLTLVRKELVRRAPASPGAHAGFRFRHSLIRDAAYGAMPKERRAELHQRFADWLERSAGPSRSSSGTISSRLTATASSSACAGRTPKVLAGRAADVLGRAGHGAFARGDMAGAANLLGRAVSLPVDARVDDLIRLAEASQGLGRLERAEAGARRGRRGRGAGGRPGAAANIALDRLDVRALVDPDLGVDELLAAAEGALVSSQSSATGAVSPAPGARSRRCT